MGKQTLEITGFILGVAIFFSIGIIPVFKFLFNSWIRSYENDIKDVKEITVNLNSALTDHMKSVYKKIDDINKNCAHRGEQIGNLQGRLNGKDK